MQSGPGAVPISAHVGMGDEDVGHNSMCSGVAVPLWGTPEKKLVGDAVVGAGRDAGGGGSCVSPVHADCIAVMFRSTRAMFRDVSAIMAARDSSVRGRPPEAAEGGGMEA